MSPNDAGTFDVVDPCLSPPLPVRTHETEPAARAQAEEMTRAVVGLTDDPVRVQTVVSGPLDLDRPGTGVYTPEGRLTARGAGGTFVLRLDLTAESVGGLEGLPVGRPTSLEAAIDDYPTKGTIYQYLIEIELPGRSLRLDPTARQPAASAARWIPPGAPGAWVVRHWRLVEVRDDRPGMFGAVRPLLEGPFPGNPGGGS